MLGSGDGVGRESSPYNKGRRKWTVASRPGPLDFTLRLRAIHGETQRFRGSGRHDRWRDSMARRLLSTETPMTLMGTRRQVVLWGSLLGIGCGESAAEPDLATSGQTSSGLTDAVAEGTTSGSESGESGMDDTTGAVDSTGTGLDACATDIEATDRIVLTTRGPVEGSTTEQGPVAFLGIPYVSPPVGDARWMPPREAVCWSDVLAADAFGPQCPQLESASGPVVGVEDCLYLNVWTPAADQGARPVMVFIHGGGNALGSASEPVYDGANLSSAGDQVVVTFNYRLGALGWLTEPNLPAVNFGLRDQTAALRWVRDNAAAFGGDPERVTVFGESAGAGNTCALLGAPAAAGLFRAAIIQSGGCSQRAATEFAEQVSGPFVTSSGCADAEDPLECLRALPAASVVTLDPTAYPALADLGGLGWGPSIDPQTLPMQTLDAMEAGQHNDVPLIIGSNAEENWKSVPELPSEATYVALVTAVFGPLSSAVLEAYPAGDYESPRDAYVALTSDLKFVCTARRSLRAAASGRSPVYRYQFAHDDYFAPGGDTGAFHGLELVYIFGNFDQVFPGIRYPSTLADERVRDTMQGLWSSFAAGGLRSDPTWPIYDPQTDPYLQLEDPLTAGQGVRTAQCDFWEQLSGG